MQCTKNIPIFNVVKVHLHIKEVDFIKFIFWHGWIQMNLSQLYYQIKEKCFLRHLWHLTKRFQRFLCILRWFLQHGILVRKFQFLSEVFARTSKRQRAVWENIFVDLLFFSVWSTSGNHCPLLVCNDDGGDHCMAKNGFWRQTLPIVREKVIKNCYQRLHKNHQNIRKWRLCSAAWLVWQAIQPFRPHPRPNKVPQLTNNFKKLRNNYQLMLSWYLDQPESHQLSLKKVC